MKQFIYVDSSEEESEYLNLRPKTEQIQKQGVFQSPNKDEKLANVKRSNTRCIEHKTSNQLLYETQYDSLVKKLLAEKVDSQTIKELITNIQDRQLAQNIARRNNLYRYFQEKMEIDQRYRETQEQKADKVKKQNERKKKVLYRYRCEEEMKIQENEAKKFIVKKQQLEHQVVKSITKQVKLLQFQRIQNGYKKMKEKMKVHQQKKANQLASKVSKQRDEIEQLYEKYEAIRQEKRINKLQQKKNLKELKQKIIDERKAFEGKYMGRKQFTVS